MRTPRLSTTAAFLGAFFGAALTARHAAASGFSTARFGGEHGNPMADNPTALYYNPGALASYPGIHIMADGNLAYRLATYERSGGAGEPPCVAAAPPGNCPAANDGKGKLSNFAGVPMLGVSAGIPLGEHRLAFGAGFFVPFGGSATWSKNDDWDVAARPSDPTYFAGPVDGPQRWYSIHGTLRTLYISFGAAFSIFDMVHIGVSAGPAISQIDSLRARTALQSTGTQFDAVTEEGRALLKTKGTDAHIGGGVLVTPLDDPKTLRIGVSYQAPPGHRKRDGSWGQKQTGTLSKNLGGNLSGDDPETDKVTVHHNMPDIFRFGGSVRPIDDVELRLFGDVTRWSLFREQCIAPAKGNTATLSGEPFADDAECEVTYTQPGDVDHGKTSDDVIANLPRQWKDAWGLRFGLSFWAIPEVELFAGVGYDSNAIPDRNLDPALTDFNDVSAALGARLKPIEQFTAALSYTHLFYVPRDTTDNAYDNTDFVAYSAGPDNRGKYTQTVGVFNIHLIGSFDPFSEKKPQEQARR